MQPTTGRDGRRVAVVTGGGGAIGSAVARGLARSGSVVVVVDPGVGVQGQELHEPTAAATVEDIEAAGGTARASDASVTDLGALESLFADVVAEFGSLDVVVDAAGVLSAHSYLETTERDWRSVFGVHFDGYVNVLSAALPLMAAAGHGRIVGFTSGTGLARTSPSDPPYGSAKRAIAALTWELGRCLPPGVAVNALSPIAASRMVWGAIAQESGGLQALDLSAMPQPDDMVPAASFLVGDELALAGQVVYSAGPELSVVGPPPVVEGARMAPDGGFGTALGTLVPVVFAPGEDLQQTTGGSNPRFAGPLDHLAPLGPPVADGGPSSPGRRQCVVVSDDARTGAAIAAELRAWGAVPIEVGPWPPEAATSSGDRSGAVFASARATLSAAGQERGAIDAVVVALGAGPSPTARVGGTGAEPAWRELLDSHRSVTEQVVSHGAWLHAAAARASQASRPVRVVHLVRATHRAGRTAAQAVAQMARSVDGITTSPSVDAFCVSVETSAPEDGRPIAQLAARLAVADDAAALRGAELAAFPGWLGLRRHPRPEVTFAFGPGPVPLWVADAIGGGPTPVPPEGSTAAEP